MKNTRYFPFERNKYFYGKLLSVDDFELEQRYVNNKRRMTNRFLQGVGVAAGLYVLNTDEQTISVENGFALDSLGREIVVDVPLIRKLSLFEGYRSSVEESDKDYVYLCLDYDEEETGVTHNVAGNSLSAGDDTAYNRIKEGYRLYLTEAEPEQETLERRALFEKRKLFYGQNGIKLWIVSPTYLPSGGCGEIQILIENLTKKYLALTCEVHLECLSYQGQSSFTVHFNEAQLEKTGYYELTYKVDGASLSDVPGSVHIAKADMHLYLNKTVLEYTGGDLEVETMLVQGDIRSRVIQDYYRTAMERIVAIHQQERLYLAKIHLQRAGESCTIVHIENVPFGQYVLNQNLSYALHQLTIEGAGQAGEHRSAEDIRLVHDRQQDKGVRLAQGNFWFDLNGGGQRGDRFISDEMPHGLGLGPVTMQIGMEDSDGVVTYGSSEIFADMEVLLELAVRVFPERGTFQVAGRLRDQVIKSGVMIHWSAMMNQEEKTVEKLKRRIFIKPSVLELAVREQHYLEAVCTNMEDKSIEWQVQEHGGNISPNGMYTAPNVPGVYEVVAKSLAYSDVRASIFVVVREA